MSSASPEVIDYLKSQLGRNPMNESGDIVRARAKEFELQPKQAPTARSAPTTAERQQVRDELDQIRQACFVDDPAVLFERLQRLPVDDFPDLAALAERLAVVVQCRQRLDLVVDDPRFDRDFLSVFQRILLSPPRDVVILREQVMANFRHRDLRRRGQGMIRLIKSEIPQLYALESDWLGTLLRTSGRNNLWGAARRDSPVYKAPEEETKGSQFPIWGVLLLLFLGGRIAMHANRTTRDRTPSSSYSAPDIQIPRKAPGESIEGWLERLSEERENSRDDGSSGDLDTAVGPPEKELDNVMDGMEFYQERRDANPALPTDLDIPLFSDPELAPYPESSSPYEPFSPFDSTEP